MSKTGAIFLYSVEPIRFDMYNFILNTLCDNGWLINKDGLIAYMTNSFDWQSAPLYEFPTVLEKIKSSIDNNYDTTIDLIHENGKEIIGLSFFNKSSIMISISENIRLLENIEMVDFSWYLSSISQVFKKIELYRIECVYD